MNKLSLAVASFAFLVNGAFASNWQTVDMSSKNLGFLLDMAGATDVTGVPVANYIQKLAKLGDKWDVQYSYDLDADKSDRREEVWTLTNHEPMNETHKATLVVKLHGAFSSTGYSAKYETKFTESN